MNRRQLLQALAAGGVIVAGELWIPGRKLISIPMPVSHNTKSMWLFDSTPAFWDEQLDGPQIIISCWNGDSQISAPVLSGNWRRVEQSAEVA